MNEPFIGRQLALELNRLSKMYPVLVITGPRQSGKTTLSKNQFSDYHYVNLENPTTREAILNSLKAFLDKFSDGLIMDEAQNLPEIFSYIQVVVDENVNAKFVLTGSSNFTLIQGISQSLAGRAAILTLLPFSLNELEAQITECSTDTLLLNGGFPAVWARNIPVQDVSKNYYNTYVERDIRQLLKVKDLTRFQNFIKLCAGRIGTELNFRHLNFID